MWFHRGYPIAAALVLAMSVSAGTAQEGTVGDLGIRVRQENLDSYWLDQSTWHEYGFRPYMNAHVQRFGSLPAYDAGANEYSFGAAATPVSADEIAAQSQKRRIQLTKYGTWH